YDKNKITKNNKDQDKIIKKERCISIIEKAEKFINKVKKILKESKVKVQIPTDIKEPLDTMCNSWKKKVKKFIDKFEPSKR
ncbi:36238_t:CDS:1, partial [Racocetra persica]